MFLIMLSQSFIINFFIDHYQSALPSFFWFALCHHHLEELLVVDNSIIIIVHFIYKLIDICVSEGLVLRL